MFFICSAAATATDPFFRKNMGERYFTPIRVVISTAGWFALFQGASFFRFILSDKQSVSFWLGYCVEFFILLAYIGASLRSLNDIKRRRASGELWHSKSRGESIFGTENTKRDLIIEGAIFLVLMFVSIPHALFFLLSRLMSYAADAMAQAAIYNRYLDIQDATIEAEFMERVLRGGLPPRKTAGLYGPLSRSITGERRANIARIVTGGPFCAPPPAKTAEPASSGA